MITVKWPDVIGNLLLSGVTQVELAEACRCSQSTISSIRRGETVDPRSQIGLTLLHTARIRGIDVPGVDVRFTA